MLEDAIHKVVAAAKKAGKAVGRPLVEPGRYQQFLDEGFYVLPGANRNQFDGGGSASLSDSLEQVAAIARPSSDVLMTVVSNRDSRIVATTSDRYKWRVVAMLWSASFFNYADRAALFTLFPLLQAEMHLSAVQLGLLGSSFAWMYGLLAPFSGNLVDRISRKKAVLGGLYAWSLIAVSAGIK